MVFTSLEYAQLLAATLLGYWLLPSRWASWVLLAASVVFYAAWSVPYLALVAASIGVGHGCALWIERLRRRGSGSGRRAVVVALIALLGGLAYFKYADFLLELAAPLIGEREPLGIELPLAISFYTFQILAYVIDVHRGAPAERSLLRFGVFVSFFPQLIAGPIVRAPELLPQLRRRLAFDAERLVSGLQLLAYGVVKKAVFADNLAVYVDRVYGNPELAGGLDVMLATVAFGAQIYCDFSGYTDIARGSARVLGIELPLNFRAPYLAGSLTEFWRRWHITLSTWLRDYLYISLGGNRAGRPRLYANLLVTMLLGGLWHGASTTFVLWGAFHGTLLAVERALGVGRGSTSPARRLAGGIVTFALVQLGWAIFRAGDFTTLATVVASVIATPLSARPWFGSAEILPFVALFYGLHAVSAWLRTRPELPPLLVRVPVAAPLLAAAIVLVTVFGGSSDAFIYFQF